MRRSTKCIGGHHIRARLEVVPMDLRDLIRPSQRQNICAVLAALIIPIHAQVQIVNLCAHRPIPDQQLLTHPIQNRTTNRD